MDDILGIPSDDHQISTLQHLCRILLDEFKVFKVESNQIKDDVYRVQRLDRIHFERLVDQMKDAGVERQEMREEMKVMKEELGGWKTRVEEMEVREGVLVKEMKRMEEELAGWKKRVTELEMGRDGERRSDVRGRSVGERGRERQVSRGRQHQRRTVSPMTWDVSIESAEETVRTSPVGVTVTTQPSKATLMSSPKKRGREEDDDEPVSKRTRSQSRPRGRSPRRREPVIVVNSDSELEESGFSVEERGRGRSVKGKGARGTFVESGRCVSTNGGRAKSVTRNQSRGRSQVRREAEDEAPRSRSRKTAYEISQESYARSRSRHRAPSMQGRWRVNDMSRSDSSALPPITPSSFSDSPAVEVLGVKCIGCGKGSGRFVGKWCLGCFTRHEDMSSERMRNDMRVGGRRDSFGLTR